MVEKREEKVCSLHDRKNEDQNMNETKSKERPAHRTPPHLFLLAIRLCFRCLFAEG